jgi:hypothetical protein
MATSVLIEGISLDELTEKLRAIVREEVKRQAIDDLQEKLLSPKEVCKLFQPAIGITTLNNWEKQGLVNKYTIGNLTWYKYSEILESLKTLKKYSRSPLKKAS